ncbi:unnamed protein product [Calypogeia fissa]
MAAAVVHAAAVVVAVARAPSDKAAVGGRQAICVSSSSAWQRGASQLRMIGAAPRTNQQRRVVVVKASGEGFEISTETKVSGDVLPSDDWPENFSLLNFEDLISHYEPTLFKAEAQPGTMVADVMSKTLYTAFPEQTLGEVLHYFDEISGFPVVDEGYKVIGVVSKKDRARASDGENSKMKEIMSSPAITLSAEKTVQDAAALMLKNKVHRIPVVNSSLQVVGIVTRTDIFTALEYKK